jgi:hypothetical protein
VPNDQKNKKSIEYKIFDKNTIDKNIDEIKNRFRDETDVELIIEGINEILFNQTLSCCRYDENTGEIEIYRASTGRFKGFDPTNFNHLSHPPKSITKKGRANIEKHPVLYVASNKQTALLEIKDQLSPGDTFYLTKWIIKFNRPTLSHWLLLNSLTRDPQHDLAIFSNEIIKGLKGALTGLKTDDHDNLIYSVQKVGDLFSEISDTYYNITSAYAHKTLYQSREKNLHIDILAYPSIKSEQRSFNFAIHPNLLKNNQIQLKQISELKFLREDAFYQEKLNISVIRRGYFNNSQFDYWRNVNFKIENGDYENIIVHTYQGRSLKINKSNQCELNLTSIKLLDWLKPFLASEKGHRYLSKNLLSSEEKSLVDLDSFTDKSNAIIPISFGTFNIKVDAYLIHSISKIEVEIEYSYNLI